MRERGRQTEGYRGREIKKGGQADKRGLDLIVSPQADKETRTRRRKERPSYY